MITKAFTPKKGVESFAIMKTPQQGARTGCLWDKSALVSGALM